MYLVSLDPDSAYPKFLPLGVGPLWHDRDDVCLNSMQCCCSLSKWNDVDHEKMIRMLQPRPTDQPTITVARRLHLRRHRRRLLVISPYYNSETRTALHGIGAVGA